MKDKKIDYQNFKELLKLKKWNQKKLCQHLGIGSISYYISKGIPLPSWIMIELIDLLELEAEQALEVFMNIKKKSFNNKEAIFIDIGKSMYQVLQKYERS